ncbi:MAG: hypothetical protein U0840_03965 [Gemmataceae bacterium]
MIRRLRGLLAALLILGIVGVTRAQDIVYYFDRASKKEQQYRGKIEEETPTGIKIQVKEGKEMVSKLVPGGIITWVFYEGAEVDKLTYRVPFSKEEKARGETRPKQRGQLLTEALEGYTQLEMQTRAKPTVRRYFLYKMAEVAVLQAQDDPTRAETAIKLLSDFKAGNTNSWQIQPALKTLARLQEEAGKFDDARKTYEELADLPDVPAAIKQESGVLVGKLLLRGNKYAEAEQRLQKLGSTLSAGDAQAPFVKAYLAECQIGQNNLANVARDLNEVIRSSSDPRLRGLAHNLLGEYYRKKGDAADAFWQYLRVDAVYNEDAEEHARALYHLATLFDTVKKDPLRGKDCASRLMDPRFAGTAYQRRLLQETKKTP